MNWKNFWTIVFYFPLWGTLALIVLISILLIADFVVHASWEELIIGIMTLWGLIGLLCLIVANR